MPDSDIATAASSDQVPTPPPQHNQDQPKLAPGDISFNIWPPNQRTRDAIIYRLVETLATPSFLSKRYGTIPSDEAYAAVRQFEDEAFAAAGCSVASDGDGTEILQVYSKEISNRMLETVKSRTTTGSAAVRRGSVASVGDGIEILHVYSKKISKRMLETVKSTTTTGSAAVESGADQAPPSDDPPSSLTTTEDAPAATEADT